MTFFLPGVISAMWHFWAGKNSGVGVACIKLPVG